MFIWVFEWAQVFLLVKILFRIAEEYRHELYYGFGLLVLISWFAFNVWVLRDYFCPFWFDPLYTVEGFKKEELEQKTQEILLRYKVSNAMSIPATIILPEVGQQRDSIHPLMCSGIRPSVSFDNRSSC